MFISRCPLSGSLQLLPCVWFNGPSELEWVGPVFVGVWFEVEKVGFNPRGEYALQMRVGVVRPKRVDHPDPDGRRLRSVSGHPGQREQSGRSTGERGAGAGAANR